MEALNKTTERIARDKINELRYQNDVFREKLKKITDFIEENERSIKTLNLIVTLCEDSSRFQSKLDFLKAELVGLRINDTTESST